MKDFKKFQFHYGSIKIALEFVGDLTDNISFNSTMVRLKSQRKLSATLPIWFQFHYGSIKMFDVGLQSLVQVAFQFHYGSIKIVSNVRYQSEVKVFQFHYGSIKMFVRASQSCQLLNGFNSTMVRLKLN